MRNLDWEAIGCIIMIWLMIFGLIVGIGFMLTHFPGFSLGLFLFAIVTALSVAMYNDLTNDYDNRGG